MTRDWLASIAHANAADWVTVGAYMLAAVMSARSAKSARQRRVHKENTFWRITAALLVLLGFNEVLDLQTLLTAVGREHAYVNGWYGDRRMVQYLFVIALLIAAVIAGMTALRLTLRMPAEVRFAMAGLVCIGIFIMLRAATFNQLWAGLFITPLQLNWAWVLEISGILTVAAAASSYVSKGDSRR